MITESGRLKVSEYFDFPTPSDEQNGQPVHTVFEISKGRWSEMMDHLVDIIKDTHVQEIKDCKESGDFCLRGLKLMPHLLSISRTNRERAAILYEGRTMLERAGQIVFNEIPSKNGGNPETPKIDMGGLKDFLRGLFDIDDE